MRHYNWCDDQAAMSSVAYACIYIAMTSNNMARLDPRRRRILLTKRRGTRLFRTIQLYYHRRPAIRGSGHDPRAADAAAVKTRLVVVAVVLL